MTSEQKDTRFIPEALDAPAPESDNPEDSESKGGRFTNLVRATASTRGGGSRGYLLGLTFVAGLLLGWLAIGWWLWPVQWTNSAPWHLRREHQKTYISLVAENFWWTKEIHRARETLAGWDDEAVAELLATMEREASSTEARQQLAALAEALEMSTPEEALWASLLSQKTILLSSILSALPLTVAIALVVSSFVQNRTRRAKGLLTEEEQLEEALEKTLTREEMALEQEEQQAEAGGDQEQEEQQTEEEEEEEGDSYDEEEEEEEEEEPWMQDLVSVLFDEEDTEFSQLQALCETLPDVDVSDLLEHSTKIADDLHRSNFIQHG